MPLLPVAEARKMIIDDLTPLGVESVALADALGRVMREDAKAQVAHPPADVSAMDGYAVRCDDISATSHSLRIVGESAAGHPYRAEVGVGEAVRIFTGAYVPRGADTIVIQENASVEGACVVVNEEPTRGRHIRRAGQDFKTGETLLTAPRRLNARDIGLLAAMNVPRVSAARRPIVGVLSTGDEIVLPGEPIADGQIVSANGPALCAFIGAHGCEPFHLGVVRDDPKALLRIAEQVRHLDFLVTSGGVSVGERDVVKGALTDAGFKATFHKIAMRPGKPLLYGRLNHLPVLGLPGNPVSALVCAMLFLGPALARLQGLPGDAPPRLTAQLGADMKENDTREDYVRASVVLRDGMLPVATPFPAQDSAMVSVFARADALIVRPPHAPAAKAGDTVSIVPLN